MIESWMMPQIERTTPHRESLGPHRGISENAHKLIQRFDLHMSSGDSSSLKGSAIRWGLKIHITEEGLAGGAINQLETFYHRIVLSSQKRQT